MTDEAGEVLMVRLGSSAGIPGGGKHAVTWNGRDMIPARVLVGEWDNA